MEPGKLTDSGQVMNITVANGESRALPTSNKTAAGKASLRYLAKVSFISIRIVRSMATFGTKTQA